MKRIILITASLLVFASFAQAQVRFGFKGGLSTSQLDQETVTANGVSVALKDANYGFHFGVFGRAKLTDHWYLQPEVIFNSMSVDFRVDDFSEGMTNSILTEKYRNLDIPLMLGWKLGPIRLEGGPTGHVYLASNSELDQIDGYQHRFNNFNLGYQAGAGLDLWKLTLDLRYEGNFSKFGEGMSIGGQELEFSQAPARWVASVGFSF